MNELKRASKTIQRVIDNNNSNLNAISVKGWIYLQAPKEDYVDKALEIFDSVLSNEESGGSHKHLDALLGRAAYYEKKKQYNVAIEIMTEI